jgi:hypothetical protein
LTTGSFVDNQVTALGERRAAKNDLRLSSESRYEVRTQGGVNVFEI